MREYKLTPIFFAQLRRRMVTIVAPLMGVAVFAGVWISSQEGRSFSPIEKIVGISVFALVLGFGFFRIRRQQEALWRSFKLVMDEQSLTRIQKDVTEVTIARHEVTKITEVPNRAIAIHASAPPRQIFAPSTIENYAELRLALAGWRSIESLPTNRAPRSLLLLVASSLLTIAAFVTAMRATNPVLVVTVSGSLLVILLFCLIQIQRSIHLSRKMKRSSWYILLPMFALGARLMAVFLQR